MMIIFQYSEHQDEYHTTLRGTFPGVLHGAHEAHRLLRTQAAQLHADSTRQHVRVFASRSTSVLSEDCTAESGGRVRALLEGSARC